MIKLAFSAPCKTDDDRKLLIDSLASTGYQGVQLKMGDYNPFLDAPEGYFVKYPNARGKISACIAGWHMTDERLNTVLPKVFAFAGHAKADIVCFVPLGARGPLSMADLHRIDDQLQKLGDQARAAGTKLSIHHHYDNPCMVRSDFDVYFNKPRSYGLTIDTAHAVKSGIRDVASLIRDFAPHIDNYHMKDFADGQFKVLGEGAVDFAPIFQAVKDTKYSGWISADEESGGDLVAGMKKCAEYLKRGLGV